MERAFSVIAIKGIDDAQRLIRGVASTPEADRLGDIVEPTGLRYKNPVPLLWQHRHDTPVGTTRFDKPTRAGIGFEATLPKVDEPGRFRDDVDHAWHAVRHGACRAVSIGFRSIEQEQIPGGGLRFKKAELLELSLVSVPAHPGATITEIRAADAAIRRGEIPSTPEASSLWLEAVAAGKMGMDQTKGTDLYQRASGAHRTALLAGDMSRAMIQMLCARIEGIEARVNQSPMKYVGTWKAGQVYPANSFCTHGGSVWFTANATDRRPAEGVDWIMAVRAGRDAR